MANLRMTMKTSLRALALTLFCWQLAASAHAVSVYVLTTDNRLMVVDGTVPQNVLSVRAITGLDSGDTAVGIDVRPANGVLYAITDGSRLYTIAPDTGVATKIGDISIGLNGSNFGMDFNPQADRLRVVSNTGQNLRIDPANGTATMDTTLAYGPPPEPHSGVTPNVSDVAYTNNAAGVGSTSLFGIDDSTFKVVQIVPPNAGMLTSIVSFGALNATHVGFDIAPDGTGFVGGKHTVPGTPVEYILATLNPVTGEGDSRGPIGDGTIPVADIAVAPTVEFSAPLYAISEDGGMATVTIVRQGFINTTLSVQYATFSDSASAASDYLTAAGTVSFAASQVSATVQIPIVNDAFPEDDEFVGLYLTNLNGPGFLGANTVASLRINANDRADRVGPLVEFIGLTGPSRGISGAVVHFNEDLEPDSASDVDNYKLTVVTRAGKVRPMSFDSAVYDPVNRKVTLGLTPFEQTKFVKMGLRINGRAASGNRPAGVQDLAGNRLDGNRDARPGGDAVQIFKVFSGTTLKYKDRDGDRVTLELTGLGPDTQLDGVMPIGGPATQTTQFWILDPIALQTSLKGTVKPGLRGDGITVISEIIGLDKKEFAPISTNSAFRINQLTFSTNATGLGVR